MNTNRLPMLEKLNRENPGDAFTMFALAKEYEKLGLTEKAKITYLALKAQRPDYVGLYFHLGKLFENEQLIIEALENYREGIEVAKRSGNLHTLSELQNAYQNLEIENQS